MLQVQGGTAPLPITSRAHPQSRLSPASSLQAEAGLRPQAPTPSQPACVLGDTFVLHTAAAGDRMKVSSLKNDLSPGMPRQSARHSTSRVCSQDLSAESVPNGSFAWAVTTECRPCNHKDLSRGFVTRICPPKALLPGPSQQGASHASTVRVSRQILWPCCESGLDAADSQRVTRGPFCWTCRNA